MQMHLSSDVQIPDGLLAANALLAENSPQGSATSTHTLHQGLYFAISSTAIGISSTLYDSRTGSRCTGKERDAESGLDYFGARYYGSSMGRFMSPDWDSDPDVVPFADLSNPQSLNLYGYVGNNPLGGTDPDGHCPKVNTEASSLDGCHPSDEGIPADAQSDGIIGLLEHAMQGATQAATEATRQALNYISAPRSFGCMMAGTFGGATAGAGTGAAVGLAGGPGAVVTVPVGAASGLGIGGAAGWGVAMSACRTGAGSSSGSSSGGGSGNQQLSNSQMRDLAKYNGMDGPVKDPPFDSHGQLVFKKGGNFFTQDVDSHSGEIWKEFNRQGQRVGTLDINLQKIGN
jgi:RHS repeat-associated protein